MQNASRSSVVAAQYYCTALHGVQARQGSTVASQALVGKVGLVVSAVRGGRGPGEVRVVVEGIAHYYIAYATVAVPAGAEVLVINNRGARHIDVEPWPRPSADDNPPGRTERST